MWVSVLVFMLQLQETRAFLNPNDILFNPKEQFLLSAFMAYLNTNFYFFFGEIKKKGLIHSAYRQLNTTSGIMSKKH